LRYPIKKTSIRFNVQITDMKYLHQKMRICQKPNPGCLNSAVLPNEPLDGFFLKFFELDMLPRLPIDFQEAGRQRSFVPWFG
jgi:hypothetical protein